MFNFFKKEKETFSSLKQAVSKTSNALVKSILGVVSQSGNIDEFVLEDIEDILIKADLGVDLASEITENIKKNNIKSDGIKEFLKNEFTKILELAGDCTLKCEEDKLNIYFIAGVNGAGKTTLIAKLGYKMKNEGKKVLLAAADTFRAAAEEQLDIWAKRAGVDILRQDGIEAAAVVYKAIEKAQNEGYNCLIVDTAGRLQNKFNLIEELKKVKNVINKKAQNANIESLLVLDANLGQNGLSQAEVFLNAVDITGAVLTKLDSSAKGGIVFAIAKQYKIPVKLIGTGEKLEDIKDFDKNEFINAIF